MRTEPGAMRKRKTVSPQGRPPPAAAGPPPRAGRWALAAWALLAALLLVGLPLFLCMPLWCDCTFYDLGARSLLRGGVLYRDLFYHGVPGMMLLQAAVRAALGWGSVALRLADFAFVSGCVWLLARQPPLGGGPRAAPVLLAALLYYCYFATTEWCHCQPDTWMLLPALAA